MANWMRAYDPTRFIHYESGRPGPDVSDVYSVMYPNLEWLKAVLADPAEKRPLMMCEYAYAKGNSTGNFFKFWDMVDAFRASRAAASGTGTTKPCCTTPRAAQPFYAYGGDFGPDFDYQRYFQQNEDPQMCCNGIVGPDLTPHPGAYEVKKVQAPVALLLERRHARWMGALPVEQTPVPHASSTWTWTWELTGRRRHRQRAACLPGRGRAESTVLEIPSACPKR
jgi:beta-galactosidase